MSVNAVVITPPIDAVPVTLRKKRWTRELVSNLENSGFFAGEHYELIDGELIDKMGKKRPHVVILSMVGCWLRGAFGEDFVNLNAPIDVLAEDNRFNEPEPDVIVLTRPATEFPTANPGPADLHLLIEVSDSTLYLDLTTKSLLYARAGIPEYWVLDVTSRRLVMHRSPLDGKYTVIRVCAQHDSVSPLAAPNAEFQVDLVLPVGLKG
jgi:Uma2 family endonuclease